jgi:hypothetical protein
MDDNCRIAGLVLALALVLALVQRLWFTQKNLIVTPQFLILSATATC